MIVQQNVVYTQGLINLHHANTFLSINLTEKKEMLEKSKNYDVKFNTIGHTIKSKLYSGQIIVENGHHTLLKRTKKDNISTSV